MKAFGKLFRTTAFKLSAVYLVLFAFGAWVALASVGWRVKEVLDEQIAETVDAEIRGLSEQYAQGGIRRLTTIVDRRSRMRGNSLYLVMTFSGVALAGNVEPTPAVPANSADLTATLYQRRGEDGVSHHALMRSFTLEGGFQLLVGHDTEDQQALHAILRRTLGASLFWLVLVGTLGGLFVAHRVLQRVDDMSASARRIMAGDLKQRLAVSDSDDELDRLAENFNAMLERIDELMAGLREVSDNIAHDLKTPLTRLRNRAEDALRADSDKERYREALSAVIEESDGLIRIFNALLMIARAEAGHLSDNADELDVGEVVRDIAEMYEPVADEQGARLSAEAPDGLMVKGVRELLGQTLVNLVDNALKYGAQPPDGRIAISAARVGDRVEIVVADKGPGVPAADRERMTGRFVRLENSRTRPGSGLGLSLAAAVARLHHGALRIEDNEPGLRVVVSLPAIARPGAASRPERGNA